MARVAPRLFPVAGLLVAGFATVVSVRTWRGEAAFAAGVAAQRRGDFNAAAAAYRAASARGSADAAIERTRLEIARGDWVGAAASLRAALALAPMRSRPRILQATLELNRPGPWDGAREERVLAACRGATAQEPGRGATWSEAAGLLLRLSALRRAHWDPARAQAVVGEAADGLAAALARSPEAAPLFLARMLEQGGDPLFLLDAAARRSNRTVLATLVGLLVDRALWTGAAPGLWAAAEAHGILPTYAAAASEALTRRGRTREALDALRRGRLADPGGGLAAGAQR